MPIELSQRSHICPWGSTVHLAATVYATFMQPNYDDGDVDDEEVKNLTWDKIAHESASPCIWFFLFWGKTAF